MEIVSSAHEGPVPFDRLPRTVLHYLALCCWYSITLSPIRPEDLLGRLEVQVPATGLDLFRDNNQPTDREACSSYGEK